MRSVIQLLELLESDNSRLFKEELLEINRNNSLLRSVFVAVGDPYTNFYVNKFKMPPSRSEENLDGSDDVIKGFLETIHTKLSTREVTGNKAKELVESLFREMSPLEQKWCLRIILKNLRCGVQSTTVNKIWPGAISVFSVQLAATLKTLHDKTKGIIINEGLKYPTWVEPKLDGLRCVAVKHNGEVTMFTRNGTPLETLPTIKASLESLKMDEFVLDGEIMGSDWNESASVVMSHKRGKDDSNMIFHVFDGMTFQQWAKQSCDMPLDSRLKEVGYLIDSLLKNDLGVRIRCVEGVKVTSEEELMQFYARCMDQGYEGVMLKDLDSPYHFKRTDSIKKMKPIATFEGIIVGHYEGRRGSKREGLWGGFEVKLPNGVITRVGSGFTDAVKAEINMNPDSWIGKIVELEGQPDPLTGDGLTVDGRVRFPVFLRIRDPRDVS